ncbi:putative reverse transcriptase domain-containing protein [Tanacetum coccineum]
MPPRAMTQAAIEKLVSDRVAAPLAQDHATRGNTNGAGGPGGNIGGNVGGQERNKVKFAAATLQGRALTWWNSQVATLGLEVANARSWNDRKIMMREEFCPPEEIQRMEVELWNLRVKDSNISAYTQRFNELVLLCSEMVLSEKKKVEAYLRGLPENIKEETTSSRPVVLNEACPPKCYNCGKMGHKEKDCRSKNVASGTNARSAVVCYECGERGHKINACPKRADGQGGNV